MLELLRSFSFRPLACVWELTLTCNLHCKHCGSFAGPRREEELDLEECLDLADQLAALGCERVTLGGGEPTLHPHWHEIGRRLTDRGVQVNIISNGWRWTEAELERARHARLASVAFSLDGFEQDHDFMRREGSFARVVEAIDRSVAAGLPAAANTTVNSRNRRSLPELLQLLVSHGVFGWQIQFGTPTGELALHPELVIEPQDLLWLVPQIAELRSSQSALEILPGDDVGYYGRFEEALRQRGGPIPFWIGCRAGCQVIGIESNGNIKGCLSLPSARNDEDRFVEGNVRHSSLEQIWNRPGAFAYNRELSEQQVGGFCSVCRYRTYCRGGCTWTAFAHTGGSGGEGEQSRRDNSYCFYRQAVAATRHELLDEPPTPQELAFFSPK